MKYSTEDLYEKRVSGHTISEISGETGINAWALYKRFQRLRKVESLQGINSKDNETLENIVSIPDESPTKTNKWSDAVSAVMIFATIIAGFFLYRKYYSQRPCKETK